MSSLQFEFDWIDVPGRAEPMVQATLARLTIHVGETIATQVFDKRARTVRDWIVTPLAPLAEWIAGHWWALLEECVTPSRSTPEFEQRHLLRTAEEGFALPDVRLLPEGDAVLVICQPRKTRFAHVDFVSWGAHRIPVAEARDALASLVDAVVTRLDQSGLADSPPQRLWQAVQETSADEADFCRVAGRLGLDPYDLDDSTSGKLLALAQQLASPLLEDLSWSVSAANLDDSAAWLLQGLHSLRACKAPTLVDPFPALPPSGSAIDPPWSVGYALADEFRRAYGLGGNEPFDPGLVFRNGQPFVKAQSNPSGLHAVVNRPRDCEPLIYTATTGSASRRFLQGRAIWACWTRAAMSEFLLTDARTSWQQQSRAFAAELLAPRDFLRSRLTTDLVGSEQIEDLAAELDVSSWVVEYQLRNHGLAHTENTF